MRTYSLSCAHALLIHSSDSWFSRFYFFKFHWLKFVQTNSTFLILRSPFLIEGNIICLNVLEVTQVNMPYCTRVYNTHVVSDLTVNFSEIEHWKQPQLRLMFRFESLQVYFQLNFLLQIEVCVKLSRYRIQEKQVGMMEVDSTFPIFANSKIFGKKSLSQIWWYYFCVQKWRLQEHFLKG